MSIMNQFKWFTSWSITLWNNCYCLIKEENCSGVPESEFKSLADKMFLKTLTEKDPKKASAFCLHCIVPMLWEPPKFDAMMYHLIDNKSVNNTNATMGSGTEHTIRSKAAKTAAMMRGVGIDIDPDGDVASMNESDWSLISAMNDVKKGVNA